MGELCIKEFIFCGECHEVREMDDSGLVEECTQCSDAEYIRSDYLEKES